MRVKNHSDELIFHSQGLRRSAANLVGSHRRIRLREILLACLSAKRFDMEVTMKLSELKENQNAVVAKLDGDNRFISRITSIGLTPGCRLQVVKNDRNRPVLVYSRDTMIALNRKECSGIEVTEV